jgi:hypothetical protein
MGKNPTALMQALPSPRKNGRYSSVSPSEATRFGSGTSTMQQYRTLERPRTGLLRPDKPAGLPKKVRPQTGKVQAQSSLIPQLGDTYCSATLIEPEIIIKPQLSIFST